MNWASVVKAPEPTAPKPAPADGDSQGAARVAVVDANAIISGLRLEGVADKFVTTQDVLDEIRDKQSRQFLATLPFSLGVLEPSEESIKTGADGLQRGAGARSGAGEAVQAGRMHAEQHVGGVRAAQHGALLQLSGSPVCKRLLPCMPFIEPAWGGMRRRGWGGQSWRWRTPGNSEQLAPTPFDPIPHPQPFHSMQSRALPVRPVTSTPCQQLTSSSWRWLTPWRLPPTAHPTCGSTLCRCALVCRLPSSLCLALTSRTQQDRVHPISTFSTEQPQASYEPAQLA